jgi:hypothetical protein
MTMAAIDDPRHDREAGSRSSTLDTTASTTCASARCAR